MKNLLFFSSVACAAAVSPNTQLESLISKYRSYQVPVQHQNRQSIVQQRRNALLKHDLLLPRGLEEEVVDTGHADVAATYSTRWESTSYLIKMKVGGQEFLVVPDTGSSDLWVYSNKVPSGSHAVYDPSKSPNSTKIEDQRWKIVYGNHDALHGIVYNDTVTVANIESPDQAVEIPTGMTSHLVQDAPDGILGLGSPIRNGCHMIPTKEKCRSFSSIESCLNHNPKRCVPFFQNIMNQLPHQLFSVAFKPKGQGHIDFGFIDHRAHTGGIQYTPTKEREGRWNIYVEEFFAGGDNINRGEKTTMLVDTGTGVILLPQPIADAYFAKAQNISYHAHFGPLFNCSTKMPDLTLHMKDMKSKMFPFTIPGDALMDTRNGTHFLTGPEQEEQEQNNTLVPDGKEICFSTIFHSYQTGILGYPFFENAFVVFDHGRQRIGLAPPA